MVRSIPSAICVSVEAQTASRIRKFSGASGGCINHAGKLTTTAGDYFLKWNDLKKFPGMFEAEARGLALLAKADALPVPAVICVGSAGDDQYLLLQYIESGPTSVDYWERFGRGLAALHRNSAAEFGLDHDNYIGSLPQRNARNTSWVEFFITQRLGVQLQLACDGNKIDTDLIKKCDTLFGRLAHIIPPEIPALVHGDLWAGNIMTTSTGAPCLIDPAVYYGHREADLAMTQLFGGFDPSFLDSYQEIYPLENGWQERVSLFNLYPLLVHVNLFGVGYLRQVLSILRQFV